MLPKYSYDRRIASDTPTFDEVAKIHFTLESNLTRAISTLSKLSDKIDQAQSQDLQKILHQMVGTASRVFDLFRPLINKGPRELARLNGASFPAARSAGSLIYQLRELDKAYRGVLSVLQSESFDKAVEASYLLTNEMAGLKAILNQFSRDYGA